MIPAWQRDDSSEYRYRGYFKRAYRFSASNLIKILKTGSRKTLKILWLLLLSSLSEAVFLALDSMFTSSRYILAQPTAAGVAVIFPCVLITHYNGADSARRSVTHPPIWVVDTADESTDTHATLHLKKANSAEKRGRKITGLRGVALG